MKKHIDTSLDLLPSPGAEPICLRDAEVRADGRIFAAGAERLDFVCELARANVLEDGGPFAAAVFLPDGRLCRAGVNRVVPGGLSVLHAEIVALSRAQGALGRFHLDGCELVSSCEPCVMCFGAVLWSGVGSLLYGASGEAARAIGFDEGDKVADWPDALRRRGITVAGPFPTDAAAAPFELYRNRNGAIY